MKYRYKATIEAVQWTGTEFSEIPEWLDRYIHWGRVRISGNTVAVNDLDGKIFIALAGDYIIFGYGRIYTKSKDLFESTFEKLEYYEV